MNKENPFSGYGKTVKGESFVGRELEIAKIAQRVLNMEFGNLSIVGLPKVGKSSLMYQALLFNKESLWADKKILTIWSSVKSYNKPKDFYLKLVLTIFSELKASNADKYLIQTLEESLVELKNDSLSFVETEHNLICFFSDIVSSGIRIVVCLDEFDYAKEVFGEVHYQLLRTLSYEPDHQIAFVTTSRRSIYDIERYSGQGSNFFGTFENIYLSGFNDNETKILFKKADDINSQDTEMIKDLTGNNPYLISMVLYKYLSPEFSNKDIDEVLDAVKIDIVKYFDDIFYVLEKDNLAEKLIRIYSGIYEGVSQGEEEYLMKYGLFIETDRNNLIPFSPFFNHYLNLKWREVPFKLIWPEAEQSIKKLITECVNDIYGDEWAELIQEDLPRSYIPEDYDLVKSLRSRRKKEKCFFAHRASNNLVDQLYPRHFPIFIELHWSEFYEDILGNTLEYWVDKLEFIAKRIRNPESHSRSNLLTDDEHKKASLICTEIIEKVARM